MSENFEELDFQNIYANFHPLIYRYLARLVNESEAEDLTQEVFIKINQNLKNFRREAKLSTWIYRIATNVAIDKLRSQSFLRTIKNRVPLTSDTDCGKPGFENNIHTNTLKNDETPSAHQQLIKIEMNKCIWNLIENLPGTYKSVVVLSILENMKNKEIAEILGISLNAVKIRLHRARKKLKKKLEQSCTFYHDKENVLSCDLKEAFKNK